MRIQDLALNRYRFCAKKTRKDSEDFLWQKFEVLLKKTVEEIGGLPNTAQGSISRKSSKNLHFVPILVSKNAEPSENDKGSDIVFFNEFYRSLISGIYLDVYVLQQWIGIKGQIIDVSNLSKKIERLKSRLNDYAKIESELPAECFCYFTEIPESNCDLEGVFSSLLETENVSIVELDYAHFAIDFGDEKTVAVIISKNFAEPEAKQKASKLFNVLLREYFLSVAKVDFETKIVNGLRSKSARQNLLNYFDWFEENQPRTLAEIESANQHLTKYRVDLAEKIKEVEIHLHTIEINISNAEKILDNPLLRPKKGDLHELLIKPLLLLSEQIKVDLTYLRIDEEKSRIIGEEIANLSNLQAGVYGRKLAWLFGLFSLIGILQLFPEFAGWKDFRQFNVRLFPEILPRIITLLILIILPILFLFRKDLKNGIKGLSKKEPFQSLEKNEIIQKKTVRGELSPVSAQDEIPKIIKEEIHSNNDLS